ncbi:MAG: NUDIX hydrolase [Parcubacteria group bacterium]|nr:NUDIX hydrolase [Parcubacteria group bacterium]
MPPQRKTVTLFVYLPEKKQVILSRRGKLERHAGLLQATVHGQIEPGEVPILAMKREFKEEAKGDYDKLQQIIELGSAVVGTKVKEQTFYHAAVMIHEEEQKLQTTQEVAEFIHVSESDVKKITPYSKVMGQDGYDFQANFTMFDDELEILKKVFAHYKK